jgi:hypothetical protein
MLRVPEIHLRHLLARNHLRPCWWVWRDHWDEPRFSESSISAWMRAIDGYPVGCFHGTPPPLHRPVHVIAGRSRGATREEVEVFLRLFPERERARLRSLD